MQVGDVEVGLCRHVARQAVEGVASSAVEVLQRAAEFHVRVERVVFRRECGVVMVDMDRHRHAALFRSHELAEVEVG